MPRAIPEMLGLWDDHQSDLEIKTASWFSIMQHGYIYMMYIYIQIYLLLIISIHIEYMYVDIWDSQKKTYSLGCRDLSCLAKTHRFHIPQIRSCPSRLVFASDWPSICLEDPDQRVSLTMRMYVRPFDSSAVCVTVRMAVENPIELIGTLLCWISDSWLIQRSG